MIARGWLTAGVAVVLSVSFAETAHASKNQKRMECMSAVRDEFRDRSQVLKDEFKRVKGILPEDELLKLRAKVREEIANCRKSSPNQADLEKCLSAAKESFVSQNEDFRKMEVKLRAQIDVLKVELESKLKACHAD